MYIHDHLHSLQPMGSQVGHSDRMEACPELVERLASLAGSCVRLQVVHAPGNFPAICAGTSNTISDEEIAESSLGTACKPKSTQGK